MADLTTTWAQRVAILGPALAGFIEVEKQFVELYRNELLNVHKSGELQQAPAGSVPAALVAGDFGSAVPGQALGPGDLTTVNSTARRPSASSTTYPQVSQQQQAQIQQQQQVAAAALPSAAAAATDNSLSTGLQQSHAMAPTEQQTPIVAATPVHSSGPAVVDQHGFENVNDVQQSGSVAASQEQQQHQQQAANVQHSQAIPSADPSAVQAPAPAAALGSSTHGQSLGQMASAPDNTNVDPIATPRSTVAPVPEQNVNPFEKGLAHEGAIQDFPIKEDLHA